MQENILFGVREFIVGCSNILIPPVDTLYNIQIPLTHWLASTMITKPCLFQVLVYLLVDEYFKVVQSGLFSKEACLYFSRRTTSYRRIIMCTLLILLFEVSGNNWADFSRSLDFRQTLNELPNFSNTS